MNHPHIVIIYYIKPSPRWITTNVSNYVLIIPDHHVIMNYVLIIPDHHVIIIINNIQQCTNPFILFMNYVYCYYYWYYCYYVYYILLLLHIIAIITKNNNYYYYYFYLLATPLLGMQNDPRLVGWFVALGLPEKNVLHPIGRGCKPVIKRSLWISSHFWLVVYLPLWKIWVRQLGWWNSQLNGKIKNVRNHQQDLHFALVFNLSYGS